MSVLEGWPVYEAAGYWHHNTGKTTALMTLLDAHLQAGASSEKVMVATFTRNARAEVRSRLATKFGLMESELPWVRTIHSSAYALLELESEKVMTPAALEQFGKESGYEMQGQLVQRNIDDPFGTVSVVTYGDWCHVAEELRRAKLLSFKEAARTFNPPEHIVGYNWNEDEIEAYALTYERWKRNNVRVDFSDMLETVLEEGLRPDINWMFVDEAQDLTPLQWRVVDAWSAGIVRQFVFGDDDQAIFQFAGADPQALWVRPGHQFVLSHSFRLPAQVHMVANRIIKQTRNRVVKEFEPHAPGGEVSEAWSWNEIDFRQEGSWLLLARNRVFLAECRKQLQEMGVPFRDRTSFAGIPDPSAARGRAIKALIDLHENRLVVRRSTIRQLRDQVRASLWPVDKIGPLTVWGLMDLLDAGATPRLIELITTAPLTALKGMDGDEHEYLRQVWKNWGIEALTTAPRIELATIHGVKGEEADHVVVSTAMTRRTFQEYEDNPDPEHRVFFVAATRAKQSLTWLKGGGGRTFYAIPDIRNKETTYGNGSHRHPNLAVGGQGPDAALSD